MLQPSLASTTTTPSISICDSNYIISSLFSSSSLSNTLIFTYTFKPYYKINLLIKYLPIFKSSSSSLSSTQGISFLIRFSDNSTAKSTYSYQ